MKTPRLYLSKRAKYHAPCFEAKGWSVCKRVLADYFTLPGSAKSVQMVFSEKPKAGYVRFRLFYRLPGYYVSVNECQEEYVLPATARKLRRVLGGVRTAPSGKVFYVCVYYWT